LNKLAGKHSLGNRARKLSQGILIVRFELPFTIQCGGCSTYIAQGTRFNAEKKEIGKYYTTPIFSFRFKCAKCTNGHVIEIQTDPQRTEYKVTEGARRKVTEFEGDKIGALQASRSSLHPNVAAEEEERDPFAGAEKSAEQAAAQRAANKRITDLYDTSVRRWGDPYTKNQLLRQRFRGEKEMSEKKVAAADALAWRVAKVVQFRKMRDRGKRKEVLKGVITTASKEGDE
ncbi:CWC16 protein, partial [Limtongia smithiae]|uniref:CWC16 protein n=1 Tax=Limtongia smithiae TaxID=1125753 RepID=UPI0034CFE4ED